MLVALTVAACLTLSVDVATAWRVGCLAIGLFVAAGALRAIAEERRGEHSLPCMLTWPVPIVAAILAMANLATAAGLYSEYAAHLCIALSIFLLFVSVTYFASLLVPETRMAGK